VGVGMSVRWQTYWPVELRGLLFGIPCRLRLMLLQRLGSFVALGWVRVPAVGLFGQAKIEQRQMFKVETGLGADFAPSLGAQVRGFDALLVPCGH
jgi:hypothetical protein